MEDRDLNILERHNPILQVAIELGINVRGGMGQCFRCERDGRGSNEFTLFFDPVKNSFFCRMCPGAGGNVIDLVCQYQDCDREKAVNWLKHRIEFDLQTREMYYQKGKRR